MCHTMQHRTVICVRLMHIPESGQGCHGFFHTLGNISCYLFQTSVVALSRGLTAKAGRSFYHVIHAFHTLVRVSAQLQSYYHALCLSCWTPTQCAFAHLAHMLQSTMHVFMASHKCVPRPMFKMSCAAWLLCSEQ
jgi:hypothetical protein